MPIRRLAPLLVNQIAAGEVIERPASVVKELVENALDAGAKRITIDIEDGGRELIRVGDDGCGIPADELPLALAAHATSKISEPDDLAAISTLGFRGEALASIASVSRLKLTSKTPGSEAGAVIEQAGDQVTEVKPVGCAPGTVIEVRNLFFNTPARRKFMRGAPTEIAHISEMTQRLAMAHAEAGFILRHNGRVMLDLPPDQPADPRKQERRAIAVLGDDIAEALLGFESDERGVKLWGMAGLPAIARATARHQYVYVNGRPVRDKNVQHAIKEAYRGLIEPTQQPVVVLFITINPHMVDMNVHPAKAEVRFADANAVHGQVLAVVRQRLLGADLTPRIGLSHEARGLSFAPGAASGLSAQASSPSVEQFVDYFRRMDPNQKGFVYEQVKQELEPLAPPEGTQPALTETVRPAAQSILQVHNSYIVTQDTQGLVIIDQHALHERVMFATLLERITGQGALESQRLLVPAVMNLSPGQMATVEKLQPLLAKLGIEADAMGPGAIGVQAFASLLFDRGVEPVEFMNELIDRAEQDDFNPSAEAALHEVLDMMSCKAAIKAGDAMSETELGELLKRKDQIDRASNCPHGRPTTIRLSLHDLEKHFKRV
ncbi:MAG: DNA mismatch repair endonuclease MutL [Phycisphaerales bacterium]